MRCLEKEPEARFNSCYDLNEALKEAIPEEEPVFPHKTHRRPRPNERTSTGPVFTPLPLGSLGEEEGDNALSQRPYLDAKERGDSKSDISMNSASDPVEPQSAWTSNSILNELLGEEELPEEPSLPSAPPTDPANEKPLLSASPFLEGPPTSPFSGMMGEFQSSDEYFEDDAPTEVGSYQPPMVEPLHPEPAPALDEKRYDSWEIDKITSEAALSESLLEGGEEMPVLSLKIELEEPPEVEPAPDDSDPVPSGFEGGLFDESVDGQGALPDAPPEEANTSGMRQADAQAEPVGTPGTLPPEAPHTLDGPDLKAPSPSGENLWEQWQERVEHDDATAQEPRFDSREMEAAINRPGRQRTLLLLILLAAVVLWFFFGN